MLSDLKTNRGDLCGLVCAALIKMVKENNHWGKGKKVCKNESYRVIYIQHTYICESARDEYVVAIIVWGKNETKNNVALLIQGNRKKKQAMGGSI